jgi:hypothetical protein
MDTVEESKINNGDLNDRQKTNINHLDHSDFIS